MRITIKIACLFLTVLMLLGVSACAGGGGGVDESSENIVTNPFESTLDRESLEYENEYTRQHLEFVAGEDYKKLCADGGGLASDVAANYEDAKLNYVNGTWQAISKASATLGEGKIELINEYEILVTKLMQNTSAEEGFTGSFEKNYLEAVIGLLKGVKTELSDANKAVDFFTGEDLEKAEEYAEKLDKILIKLQKLDGVSDEEATGLYGDAVKQVKELFETDFIKGNEKFLKSVKGFLGKAAKVTGFASDKLTIVVDEYLMYQAMAKTGEEWESVWSSISSEAKSAASSVSEKKLRESYEKIAECIDKIIARTKAYRSDNASGIFLTVLETGAETVRDLALSAGYKAWDEIMKCWPVGQAVRTGLVAGVGVANLLANCDDIAYYGQMLIGYGRLGECAYVVLEKAGKELESKKTYNSALLFDKAFNIYKEIQLSACDCTISYCTAIVDNPLGYIFKYTSDDQITQTYIIQIYKADWLPLRCHGLQKIINNGGHVVGYNGNVYYFKLSAESVEDTGTNANFTVNSNVSNDLICRSSEGKETVIAKTNATGGIYICGEKLYYRKQDYKWYSIGFDGKGESLALSGQIIGDLSVKGMLIVKTNEGDIYGTDFGGNRINLLPAGYTGVSADDSYYYNYRFDSKGYYFYRYSFETDKNELIGEANIPEKGDMGRNLDDICVSNNGIYFLIGYYAGTGYFFQEGCIYYLAFETGEVSLVVNDDITLPMMYLADGEDTKYLYYYNTQSVLGVELFKGSINENVRRINLTTGETDTVSFPLCGEGVPFINGGKLQVLLDGKNSPTDMLTDDMIKKMGYTASLGFDDNGNALYHQFAEIVGDNYYVSIMHVVPDDKSSLGWRQGYRRVSTRLYRISNDGEETELIYEY